jgi:hypothetical protein
MLLLFSYHRFSFPWHFSSSASGEPQHSGFKSQIVALSLFMCDVSTAVFFVENLLNVVLILFPDVFLTITYNSRSPNDNWYDKIFHVPQYFNLFSASFRIAFKSDGIAT